MSIAGTIDSHKSISMVELAEPMEDFVRERLGRILSGELNGVIAGLRRMISTRELSQAAQSEIETVRRYFENNASRMHVKFARKRRIPLLLWTQTHISAIVNHR